MRRVAEEAPVIGKAIDGVDGRLVRDHRAEEVSMKNGLWNVKPVR